MGRNTEAYARLRRAAALDPVSLTINYDFGLHFARTRDYAQAADRLRKAIELDPSSGFVHHMLGELYAERGMFSEAIGELERAIELSGPIPHFVAMIAHVKALGGDRVAPAKAVAELKALSEHGYVSPYDIALVYLSAGNREQALHFLDGRISNAIPGSALIQVRPRFDALDDDVAVPGSDAADRARGVLKTSPRRLAPELQHSITRGFGPN